MKRNALIVLIILLALVLLAAIVFIAVAPAMGNNTVNEETNPENVRTEFSGKDITEDSAVSQNEPTRETQEVAEVPEEKPVADEDEEASPTEAKPTEPKPTEPKPTEPKPTEPKPTEPKPTEPKPTEPKPTEPEATEPNPTEAPKEPEVGENGLPFQPG